MPSSHLRGGSIACFFSWPSLISASLAIAFGVGHIMQSLEDYPSRQTARGSNTVALDNGKLILSNVAFTSATNDDLKQHKIVNPLDAMRALYPRGFTAPPKEGAPTLANTVCHPDVTTALTDDAIIAIDVTSDCTAGLMFDIHHNGMIVSAQLNDDGDAHLEIPALAERAIVIVDFPNLQPKVISHTVATFKNYARSVLQWQGPYVLGMTTSHDDVPVEMYQMGTIDGHQSVVMSHAITTETPDVFIIAAQSDSICNASLDFQYLQFAPNQSAKIRDYQNTVVQCSEGNDILVLKNLYQDAKVARN